MCSNRNIYDKGGISMIGIKRIIVSLVCVLGLMLFLGFKNIYIQNHIQFSYLDVAAIFSILVSINLIFNQLKNEHKQEQDYQYYFVLDSAFRNMVVSSYELEKASRELKDQTGTIALSVQSKKFLSNGKTIYYKMQKLNPPIEGMTFNEYLKIPRSNKENLFKKSFRLFF